jgi:hypothetical protein
MSQHVGQAGDDAPMGRTYGLVILCEIAVVIVLWWFGRAFSS